MDELTIGKEEFKALSSETRIEIIKLLNSRNYTLSELSTKLKMSSPTIKQHLETLVHSNLIQQKDEGRKWKYYSLTRKGKKLIEPESHNVMILLGATIVGCLFLVYIIFGTNLVGLSSTDKPLQAAYNEMYSAQAEPKTKEDERNASETIQEILAKSKNMTNMEFNLVEKSNGELKTSKYYLREGKYRTETQIGDTKVVQIYDGNNLYAYSGYNGLETEKSLEAIADALPSVIEDPAGIQETAKEALNSPELKEVGREAVNGLNARVIEYTFNEQKIKAWVSEEYGIAVKKETEVQIEGEIIKHTTELQNIKIGSVAESFFKIG